MDFAGIKVFELGGAGLGDFDVGDEGKDDICRVSLFDMGLDSKRICGIDENAGVLGSNDRLNDGGEVVDIREGLDAENHVVVGGFTG